MELDATAIAPEPPMVIATERRYSLDEYRSREASAEERHEYRNGEIVPMPGGSANHSAIALNLAAFLLVALRDTDSRVYGSDLRLWIPEVQRGTYPDVMVTDGALVFNRDSNGDRADEILNPVLIAEVLSPSTEAYDRGDKFRAYRTITTLRHYLLISQDCPCVEHYEKLDDQRWSFVDCTDPEGAITIQQPSLEIPLPELYRRIEFA
ncbi:MAG: Uma2 family endonuclease [Cyanophyceae cyanobacterium]